MASQIDSNVNEAKKLSNLTFPALRPPSFEIEISSKTGKVAFFNSPNSEGIRKCSKGPDINTLDD
jgi:hypothetical protein